MRTSTALVLGLPLLVPTAAGQQLGILRQEGDAVAGIGNVTAVNNLFVGSNGHVYLECDTDNANTNADEVLLDGGTVVLREGDPLALPAGASVGTFDDLSANYAGIGGINLFLDGLTTTTDSGVFYGPTLVIQESAVSTAPQFSAGTPYIGFFGTRIVESGRIMIMASVDDPAIASTVDRALVLATIDPGSGALLSEGVLFKEGDVLPGIADSVTDFGTNPHTWAFNQMGQTLYVATLTGLVANNAAIYRDGTLLVRKGDVDPITGRLWESITSSTPVDLNDYGQWVFRGNLDGATGDDDMIVKNGNQKVIQEGDTLADIGGVFTFTAFGSGPVQISNAGDVLWFGDWNDPVTTQDTGLFLNDRLLVQEGVTTVAGQTVVSLSGIQDGYGMSRDGRRIVFRCQLTGGIAAAVQIDFQQPEAFCFGDGTPGVTACPCANLGTLTHGCANSRAGSAGALLDFSGTTTPDTIVLRASEMLPSATNIFLQGDNLAGAGAVFGDGVRCAGGQLLRLGTKSAVFGSAVHPAPADPSISARAAALGAPIPPGGVRHYQTYYRDPSATFCVNPPGNTWNVTHGLTLTWN